MTGLRCCVNTPVADCVLPSKSPASVAARAVDSWPPTTLAPGVAWAAAVCEGDGGVAVEPGALVDSVVLPPVLPNGLETEAAPVLEGIFAAVSVDGVVPVGGVVVPGGIVGGVVVPG